MAEHGEQGDGGADNGERHGEVRGVVGGQGDGGHGHHSGRRLGEDPGDLDADDVRRREQEEAGHRGLQVRSGEDVGVGDVRPGVHRQRDQEHDSRGGLAAECRGGHREHGEHAGEDGEHEVGAARDHERQRQRLGAQHQADGWL